MTIKVDENTRIAAVWFMDAGPSAGFDWLCVISQEKPGASWHATYRFRYHAESGNDADDQKSWYAFAANDDSDDERARIVKVVRGMAQSLARMAGGELDETLDVGGADEFIALMSSKPWGHVSSTMGAQMEAEA
jgi:hypothetical protein